MSQHSFSSRLMHHVPEFVACAAQERGIAALASLGEPESSIAAAVREHGSSPYHGCTRSMSTLQDRTDDVWP